jgi:hypothetical protein
MLLSLCRLGRLFSVNCRICGRLLCRGRLLDSGFFSSHFSGHGLVNPRRLFRLNGFFSLHNLRLRGSSLLVEVFLRLVPSGVHRLKDRRLRKRDRFFSGGILVNGLDFDGGLGVGFLSWLLLLGGWNFL